MARQNGDESEIHTLVHYSGSRADLCADPPRPAYPGGLGLVVD